MVGVDPDDGSASETITCSTIGVASGVSAPVTSVDWVGVSTPGATSDSTGKVGSGGRLVWGGVELASEPEPISRAGVIWGEGSLSGTSAGERVDSSGWSTLLTEVTSGGPSGVPLREAPASGGS